MRRLMALTGLGLMSFLGIGCTRHLIFLENSHVGLKAAFEPNQPTPAEVDIGWRRAMFAMVPQKSAASDDAERKKAPAGSVTVETVNGVQTITVVPDPDELMSMYSVYQGTIGFNDPIEIYHFLATGVAASNLLANEKALRELTREVKGASCEPSMAPTPTTPGVHP